MSKREALARVNLIIQRLRRGPADFESLERYLITQGEIDGYNYAVSQRTLQRDIREIKSLYRIEIQNNKSDHTYYIAEDEREEQNSRMLEAFDTLHALNLTDRLSKYIIFEARKPRGTEHLHGLLFAIENRRIVRFQYQKPIDAHPLSRETEPYALKEFKNRWYLIAKDLKGQVIKIFSLERITELDIAKTEFDYPKDLNLAERYRYCFGIMSPHAAEPSEVVLSFHPFQGKYIKAMPLHATQRILSDNNQELRISLRVFLTEDFLMELQSYGALVKVLQPDSLREDLKNRLQKAWKQYGGQE